MAKAAKTTFECRDCGAQSLKWAGQCPECRAWNTLSEMALSSSSRVVHATQVGQAVVQELASVQSASASRIALPYREVNRVLGGGLVPGSLTLVGGDPGIGKSTLLLQIAQGVAGAHGPVMYVSGEESPQQVKLRAERLGIEGNRLFFVAETNLELVIQRLEEARPTLAIIDSIQTMYLEHVSSGAGSVAQVREATLRLMQWAKARGVPVIIAGHVTKEGAIAGPKLLEHMVDVVLYLEGESFSAYRILRGVKNRFGSTNEVGIFEMRDAGLLEVNNPSEVFLAHRQEGAVGSAIVPTLEGTRPLLVEIQALVTPTTGPIPRRTCNGADFNRLMLICAVLTKHVGLGLGSLDIVVNVAGGMRVNEPAADLGVAAAIVSSLRDAPLQGACFVVGEVGLSGELRPVNQIDRRIGEAAMMGFRTCVLPKASIQRAGGAGANIGMLGANSVRDALRLALVAGSQNSARTNNDRY